jgi:hypothetical protein
MNEMQLYPGLLHRALNGVITSSTQTTLNLSSTTTSGLAIPIQLFATETINFVEIHLAAGASTGFRCRIVNRDTDGLPDTTSLVHANATASITATANAWNRHDFTDFSLAAGQYWIVWDVTQITTTLTPSYISDYRTLSAQADVSNLRLVYFDGADWDQSLTAGAGSVRARIKATSGYLWQLSMAPCLGRSGIDNLLMDTSENPNCRGQRWVADYSGDVIGWDISVTTFSGSTSYEFVMATQGCAVELARTEVWEQPCYATTCIHKVRFDAPVAVVAGTSYDVYIHPGSDAGAATGVGIAAIDVSEDSATMIQCYGPAVGVFTGFSVHNPPTEGGAGTPTTSSDYVFPWVPIYRDIASGGTGIMRVCVSAG